MQSKKTYDLNFAGLSFKLRSAHDEQTVNELARFVDQKMQKALLSLKSGSYQSAAVLTALNIAEELILLKKRSLAELEQLEKRTQRLLELQALVSPKQATGTGHDNQRKPSATV